MKEIIKTALSILDAYVQEFHPQATQSLLYEAAKLIIPKLEHPELLEQEIQALAEEIATEYQLNKGMIPPPSKSAKAIAAEVAVEIDQFKQERLSTLKSVDVTQPTIFGDLEVGSPIQKTS